MGGMFTGTFDLEPEKLAFALEEPRPETTDLVHWENQPGESEHGAIVVPQDGAG